MSFRPEFRWVMSFHFTSGAQTLGLFAAAFLSCSSSFAGRLATQTVTFSVNAIDEIDLTGNPGAMTVSIATAGAPPNTVTDNSTRYAITTNGENRKITAMINHAMPAGVVLTLALAAPTGAISTGAVQIDTTPADVVTNISGRNESAKTIANALSASAEAGLVSF